MRLIYLIRFLKFLSDHRKHIMIAVTIAAIAAAVYSHLRASIAAVVMLIQVVIAIVISHQIIFHFSM